MAILFWGIVGVLIYSVVGYGLLVAVLAQLIGRSDETSEPLALEVTLLIAAHNEERHIGKKLENVLAIDKGTARCRIVVACDGCTDRTVEIANSYRECGVTVLNTPAHIGKIGVLNGALHNISSDIVVFSDANSELERSALVRLLSHFADPGVGGVCGAIELPGENRPGWLALGEALYWRLDNSLKTWESRLAGAVSAQGSLYAIRRELIAEVPPAVADDLFISLRVVEKGFRLVFEPQARVSEGVSSSELAEFGRRVRSTERGWRGLMMMRTLLNPFKFGFYSVQLFSHKVLRRLVPFQCVTLFVLSLALAPTGPFYMVLAVAQLLGILVAGLLWHFRSLLPSWALVPVFVIAGNLAIARGVINAMTGRRSDRWEPSR